MHDSNDVYIDPYDVLYNHNTDTMSFKPNPDDHVVTDIDTTIVNKFR